jgi:proton glutamate symport protein
VFLALVAGFVVGVTLAAVNPILAGQIASVTSVVGTLWINLVRMTVVPLVVALLFVSVAGSSAVADGGEGTDTITREGIAAIAAFVGLLTLSAFAAFILAPAVMDSAPIDLDSISALRMSASQTAESTQEAVKRLPGFSVWVGALVPTNVVKAAADGAMLSLVVFVLIFALAARRLAPAGRATLVAFFSMISDAMTRIVEWVIALAPIGVFALIIGPAASSGGSLAGAMGYYVVSISLVLMLFTLLLYPVAHVAGIPLPRFVRGVFPSQAVALASSSSLASLPALIEGARRLAIPDRIAGFTLPLAVATFKIATPITWGVGTLFLARLYGVELTTLDMATLLLTSVVLSFSIPGVPQGAWLLMAPVVASLSIPPEGVALLIAVDTIPDLFGTMTNVTGDMVATAVVARATSGSAPSSNA